MDRLEPLFAIAQIALPSLGKPKVGLPVESPEPLTTPLTVVEIAVPVTDDPDDPLSAAFDRGLRILRAFQRAYFLVRRIPFKLVSRERLPGFIPFGIREISEEGDQWPDTLGLFQLSWNFTPRSRDAELTSSELEHIQLALDLQPGTRVFASYADLRRDAINAYKAEGDYRASVLFVAAASEVFLDDLLAHLIWEEGVRPEDAAATFEGGLQRRLRTAFHSRLGGSGWSVTVPGALQQWNHDIARVRHRVIHAGHDATGTEASRAIDALASLESFVAERVLSVDSIRKYPRTAIVLYGETELERRAKWDARLQSLADDASEVAWAATFVRWKNAMQRARSERPPDWKEPNVDVAIVVGVVHPGSDVVWVLHDRDAHMARRAEAPHVITSEQSASLERFLLGRPSHGPPVSLAFFEVMARPLDGFDWVPEYRLLPMAGVMVTGIDLDPASP